MPGSSPGGRGARTAADARAAGAAGPSPAARALTLDGPVLGQTGAAVGNSKAAEHGGGGAAGHQQHQQQQHGPAVAAVGLSPPESPLAARNRYQAEF